MGNSNTTIEKKNITGNVKGTQLVGALWDQCFFETRGKNWSLFSSQTQEVPKARFGLSSVSTKQMWFKILTVDSMGPREPLSADYPLANVVDDAAFELTVFFFSLGVLKL